MKCHQLSGSNKKNILWKPAVVAGRQESRCHPSWFLLRAVKEGGVLGLSPRLVDVSLCVQMPPFYKDTSCIG